MEGILHPNPQFARAGIVLLNGEWEFEKGIDRRRLAGRLGGKIRVPFCIESTLSGIGDREFCTECTYAKEFVLEKKPNGERLFLHFGAVDYVAEVYCNGEHVLSHEGGYTPFAAEITDVVREGGNRITVYVRDDTRKNIPSGKQSSRPGSYGCFYTRVTGIWQSVWLERTPREYIKSVRFNPDALHGTVSVALEVDGKAHAEAEVTIGYDGRTVGFAAVSAGEPANIALQERHLWEVGKGRLYDVTIRYGQDEVKSYFGLRSVGYEGKKFLLNGKSVFQRLVLDQGYYPQGIYTAADERELKRDIELSMALGFNGARLHQKVFDPYFLYLCDRAGYMVWGEFASWGIQNETLEAKDTFLRQWSEVIARDANHPCIVTWCPMNEAWTNEESGAARDIRLVEAVYALTKRLDGTRPCVDVSGGYHSYETDIVDFHCYDPYDKLKERIEKMERGEIDFLNVYLAGEGPAYAGEPLNLSEFGGIAYRSKEEAEPREEGEAWGYDSIGDEESFLGNYERTAELLLKSPSLSGFCYTQLYDVEQEQNGLYTYARKAKFSERGMERIRKANAMRAAIEEEEK